MTTPFAPPTDRDSLRPDIQDHLHRALDVDDGDAKNYHIRSALQLCVVEADRE